MTKQGRTAAGDERLTTLFKLALDGDAPAYQAFLKTLAGHLRGYFRKRLSRLPDEVEDLVQETLLAIHNQRQTYDASMPLGAWIFAIARYKLVDLLRRRSGREALTDSLEDEAELFAVSDTEAAEARRDLGKLLERLPEHFRLPIVHTKLEGLSVAEAARAAGMSESAIKVGVHRGLKALADLIRGGK